MAPHPGLPVFGSAAGQTPVCLSICSMADFSSASLSDGSPPRGGIEPLPAVADFTRPASPPAADLRVPQADLSPIFGAPRTPAPWHAVQTLATTSPPDIGARDA